MKVLLLNQSDSSGGAARAAYRLHQGLQRHGVTTQMLVQHKLKDDPTVIAPKGRWQESVAHLRFAIDALPLKAYPQRDRTPFSIQWLPSRLAAHVRAIAPDVVNLHWLSEAFVPVQALRSLNRPLVMTLHDMWAFTGGCHYTQGCDRFLSACGRCPQLKSDREADLSRWTWQRKAKYWKDLDLTIVALSHWMAAMARASPLLQPYPIRLIPNGLDLQVYRPVERQLARRLLNLPPDQKLVLFGALQATSDPRKGFHLLQAALHHLQEMGWRSHLSLGVMGALPPPHPVNLGFETHYLGTLTDDLMLVLAYAAADVFVLPSTQENLANTVMEALACGTPSVAFHIGGMPDLIDHQINGYLAAPFSTQDLAAGIAWVLEQGDRYQQLSHQARFKAEQAFSLEQQAQRYLALFQEVQSRSAGEHRHQHAVPGATPLGRPQIGCAGHGQHDSNTPKPRDG